MSDNEDFEEQLRLEEEEKRKRAAAIASSTSRTRRDDDGTEYEWNEKRQAWFPKIDQDIIVQYQMSYGGSQQDTQAAPVDTNSAEYREWYQKYMEYVQQFADKQAKGETAEDATAGMSEQDKANYEYWQKYYAYWYQQQQQQHNSDSADAAAVQSANESNQQQNPDGVASDTEKDDPKKKKKKKPAETPAVWFEAGEVHTPGVYVSNLPTDITEDEFKDLMNKCGLIAFDSLTRKLKLKLYKDANGQLKGDGWCCYIKNESVELALQILDGYDVKGKTIKVEKAKYEMKGNFDPTKKKRKLTSKEKQKLKAKQEKLFDWRPDAPVVGLRPKHERVVILKNLFTPEEFDREPQKLNEISEDIRSECSKFGEVKKVVVYDRNSDGVAAVTMNEPEEADTCIQALHTRWFAGRRILAETWDGKTKYLVEETEEEKKKRIAQWEKFLEEDERMKRLREEADAKFAGAAAAPVPEQDIESDDNLEESDSDNDTPASDSAANTATSEMTDNATVSGVGSNSN